MIQRLPRLFIALTLACFLACSRDGGSGETAVPTGGGGGAAPAPAARLIEPPSRAGSAPAVAREPGELLLTLPAGWEQEPPSSGMRLAQARIPGPGGPGEFALFYFGPGGGGGTEANIERWIGQVEADPDSQARRDRFEANGLALTWVEVDGTLKASGMGMGPAEDRPGYRLLGAVVEGPGGPWFIKVTGPRATLAAEREAFFTMLRNLTVG